MAGMATFGAAAFAGVGAGAASGVGLAAAGAAAGAPPILGRSAAGVGAGLSSLLAMALAMPATSAGCVIYYCVGGGDEMRDGFHGVRYTL
jgi:hypothetical protein